MGFSSSWVFTALFMHNDLNVNYFLIGLVFTISGLTSAVSQVYVGRAGDKVGHKRILILLVSLSSVVYLLIYYLSITSVSILTFSALFVAVMSINSAMLSPVNSLVSLSSESPLKGFSYLRMGNNVGWGFGPFVAGVIATPFGYQIIYLMGLLSSAINLGIVLFATEVKGKLSEPARRRGVGIGSVYIFLGISALLLFMIQGQESVTFTNFAVQFRQMTAFDIGIIFLVNGMIVVLFQTSITRITSRIGLSRGFMLGIALYAFGFFTMAFDYNLYEFIISITIATVGENFSFPAGNAIVSTLTRNRDIGYHMGVFNAFISVGRSMGPVVGGYTLSVFTNPVEIWAAVTVSGLISILIFFATLSDKVSKAEQSRTVEPF